MPGLVLSKARLCSDMNMPCSQVNEANQEQDTPTVEEGGGSIGHAYESTAAAAEPTTSPFVYVASEGSALSSIALSATSGAACLVDQETKSRVTWISKEGSILREVTAPGPIGAACFVDDSGNEVLVVKINELIMVQSPCGSLCERRA